MAHEHRTRLRDWLGRKAFYGTSAAPLSVRHPDKTAPVVISASSLLVWLPMSMGSMTGYLASLLVAGFSTRRVARTMQNTEANHRDVALLALRGIGAAALQLSAAICRHYWPVALAGALISRRCRQAVLLAAVIDGVHDWITRRRNSDVEGKADRAGRLHRAQTPRRPGLRRRAVDRCGAGADVASAQAADQDVIDGSGRSHHAQ